MTGGGEVEEEEGCDFRAEIEADVANSVAVGDGGDHGGSSWAVSIFESQTKCCSYEYWNKCISSFKKKK